MSRTRLARLVALLLALTLVTAACSQRDDGDDNTSTGDTSGNTDDTTGDGEDVSSIDTSNCPTDPSTPIEGDTIKLVSSYPQSGLTAAFAQIANGWKAYFDYLNEEEGGVEIAGKKYKIETEDKNDEYNAQKTSQNIEEMVGTDGEGAFGAFSVVGTANNIAIRDLLGELCVPNLFAATGSPAWGNPDYPWTIGSTLAPYTLEGQVFEQYLSDEKPDASVAMLVQDDDFGAAYEEGFKSAIEDTDITVSKVERYAPGANEVSSQITSLASGNSDAFFDGGTLLACPDALTKAKAAGWTPITWISTTCTSKTLMGIADTAGGNDGVLSMTNQKDPLNPAWAEDEAMQLYMEKVEQYSPEAEVDNAIVGYGWTQAALLVEAMKTAKTASRLGVMDAVRNMDGITGGLLLPGVEITTGPDDCYMGETVTLMQYDLAKKYFELVGEPIDFEGKTAESTPEDLITG
jgi:branched-chain amino acid transport system substrate-binding protein